MSPRPAESCSLDLDRQSMQTSQAGYKAYQYSFCGTYINLGSNALQKEIMTNNFPLGKLETSGPYTSSGPAGIFLPNRRKASIMKFLIVIMTALLIATATYQLKTAVENTAPGSQVQTAKTLPAEAEQSCLAGLNCIKPAANGPTIIVLLFCLVFIMNSPRRRIMPGPSNKRNSA